MDADVGALLTVAFHSTVREANIEAGYERFAALSAWPMDYGAFCDAVAFSVQAGLIREPIRLPEGALQCHWRLELTPAGAEAARGALEMVRINKVCKISAHSDSA